MADRGILFSAPMVLALLADRKTQTRRLAEAKVRLIKSTTLHPLDVTAPMDEHRFYVARARYAVGDRLWVREAWRADPRLDRVPPRDIDTKHPGIKYEATDHLHGMGLDGRLRASMHMPRWASRITLIVTAVRVQRLQEISNEDAVAEGAPIDPNYHDHSADQSAPPMVQLTAWSHVTVRGWYHRLIDEINGAGTWDRNPWVVAYTFTVHKQNIDS